MGGERHGSKSGRYVGGFLQLFDWNAKSRKKLFPSTSDLQEQPKQGKKCQDNLPITRMHVVEEEDFGAGLSTRGGSEYSYASSVTDDDGYGTKAPGVVARLMGLDSLPTSNAVDPYSSPFFDSLSLQDASFRERHFESYRDRQAMESSSKIGKTSRNSTLPNKPIEKFQSEMLPPKSAKTIPITHHKLLSPIKSPIFVPSRDAAHIMEYASKIIEPGPQATSRAKITSLGSSSVPLKVREMRGKVEASQRPLKATEPSHREVEPIATKYLKRQPMNKSANGGKVYPSRDDGSANGGKVDQSRDDGSSTNKYQGKSISLAIQAKVNVQKREGLTSNRSLASEEQGDGTKSTQLSRNQVSSSKSSNRKSLTQTTSVLRQNNQKQNCPKTSMDMSTGKKAVTEDSSRGQHKTLTRDCGPRTSSRKSSLHVRDDDKSTPYSGAKNAPRKKRSADNMLERKQENPSQSSLVTDRQFTWIEDNRRKGMDVVSFTFSAPITRSLSEKSTDLYTDERSKTLRNSDITKLSSPGFSGLKGDALSILLEQKLKELASNLGSPHSFAKTGRTAESSPGSVESAIGKAREKAAQRELRVNGENSQMYSQSIRRTFNFQAGEAVEDYNKNTEIKQWNPHIPSPVSILEPSMLTESCYSSESLTSSSTEESKPCSSVWAREVVSSSSVQKFHPMEIDKDTSDSASSQITAIKSSVKRTSSELGYVKNILCNVELMFKDYMTGRTREIVNPHLFDQMERRALMGPGETKLERKVLFDCVGECLDLKCQRFVGGGFDTWRKGVATLKRKERLGEEVYKEIEGWRSLGNCMVDELVDKDMSSKYGRWLDFEVDEFMLGVEIEGNILDSMVGEIVEDLLASLCC
ncbi:uncharacterized protein LOC141657109 [Silene latifolia]|uniref:uncharacterized protein LOC141657109 n=1 Tax=Silene latifolia TaxID=37657 RepID=UPI003D774AEF